MRIASTWKEAVHSTLPVSDLKCLDDAELVAGAGPVKYGDFMDKHLEGGTSKAAK